MVNKKHREEYIHNNLRELISLQGERNEIEKKVNNYLTNWLILNKQIKVISKRLNSILND